MTGKPKLAAGTRLQWDAVRERTVLLFPEGALALNATAAAVLELCDGTRTIDQLSEKLRGRYKGTEVRGDIVALVEAIAARGLLVDADA